MDNLTCSARKVKPSLLRWLPAALLAALAVVTGLYGLPALQAVLCVGTALSAALAGEAAVAARYP
jgi:hypothetical protein